MSNRGWGYSNISNRGYSNISNIVGGYSNISIRGWGYRIEVLEDEVVAT